jgi:hypothetical protein
MLDDIDRISATWCTRYSSGRIDVDTSEGLGVALLMSDSWQVSWAPTSTTAKRAACRASFATARRRRCGWGRVVNRNQNQQQKRNKNHEHEQQRDQDHEDQQNKRSHQHEDKTIRREIKDQKEKAKEEERSPNRAGILMPSAVRPHKTDAASRYRRHLMEALSVRSARQVLQRLRGVERDASTHCFDPGSEGRPPQTCT